MQWSDTHFSPNHEVSSTGLIRNKKSGRILKPWKQNGYYTIRFTKGGKNRLIHRVVAFAFIPIELNKEFVNHKNGNKLDNNIENLEWCTKSENSQHAVDTGLVTQGFKKNHINSIGSKNTKSKLIESDIKKIRSLRKEGLTLKQISDKFNVHFATIGYIIQGKTWSHVK